MIEYVYCRDWTSFLVRSCINLGVTNEKLQDENKDLGRRNRYRDLVRTWECRVIHSSCVVYFQTTSEVG